MAGDMWIALVIASAALLAIPGPVVMLLFSYTLGQGRKVSWAAIPGVVLGDFVAMSLSLLGAGAVLSASATVFFVMKVAGAAYLIWLGIGIWRAKTEITLLTSIGQQSRRSVFKHAFFVTALNPKDIMFFVAFLPQFINTTDPALPQLMIIEFTFLTMVAISTTLWIVCSGILRNRLRGADGMQRANKLGGGCLIGAGALTALMQQ